MYCAFLLHAFGVKVVTGSDIVVPLGTLDGLAKEPVVINEEQYCLSASGDEVDMVLFSLYFSEEGRNVAIGIYIMDAEWRKLFLSETNDFECVVAGPELIVWLNDESRGVAYDETDEMFYGLAVCRSDQGRWALLCEAEYLRKPTEATLSRETSR